VPGHIERDAPGHAEDPRLGGTVGGLLRVGDDRAGDRRHVHDATVLARDHAGDDATRHVELGLEVDGDAEVPSLLGEVLEGREVLLLPVDDHAGVVDEDVDPPVRGEDLVHHHLDLVHPCQVGRVRRHREALGAQQLGAVVHRLGDVDDGEHRALAPEDARGGEADAVRLRHPGDEGDLVLDPAFAIHGPCSSLQSGGTADPRRHVPSIVCRAPDLVSRRGEDFGGQDTSNGAWR